MTKGYASYWYALAIERTKKKQDRLAALNIYLSIANGKITAPDGYRLKALLQAADLLHYDLGEYSEAYRIYKLMLDSDWLSAEGKADIQAEVAGCFLELMDSGNKGNPAEVRHQLKKIYAEMSDNFPTQKATVELIYSETWFWEGKEALHAALDYADYLAMKYSTVPRVQFQALWNKAVALERMDRLSESKEAAAKAAELFVDAEQSFRTRWKPWNMEKRVSKLMARLNQKLGNIPEREMWLENYKTIEFTTPTLNSRIPGDRR